MKKQFQRQAGSLVRPYQRRRRKKRGVTGAPETDLLAGWFLASRAVGKSLPPLQPAQRHADALYLNQVLGNRAAQRCLHADMQPIEEAQRVQTPHTLAPITAEPFKKEGIEDAGLPVHVSLSLVGRQNQRSSRRRLRHRDGIQAGLGFSSGVERTLQPGPEAFGEEQATIGLDQIRYTPEPSGVDVEARVCVDCAWGVQSLGNKDILSENTPDVNAAQWGAVHADLSPNEEGIPIRKHYWASDLTARHEQFHAKDDIQQAEKDLPEVENWLSEQQVSQRGLDVGIMRLLENARRKVQDGIENHYVEGGEERAYGDGKPLYEARVNAIEDRASREGW